MPHPQNFSPRHSEQRSLTHSKLIFDGSPTGQPVERFLFQVERVAGTMRIPPEVLVDEFSYVLKGTARDWYWAYLERNPHVSWLGLKHVFAERFQDRRSDYDIKRAIESYKQQPKESFLDFYNHILAMAMQSRQMVSDTDLLHILQRNMRAGLQVVQADKQFHSVGELVKSCVSLEDTWRRLRYEPEMFFQQKRFVNELDYQFENPPTVPSPIFHNPESHSSPISSVDEFNYSRTSGGSKPVYATTINAQNYTTRPPANKPKTDLIICWNCCDIGHAFKNCPLPINRIFCFKCGQNGTLAPQCFSCKGNFTRGSWRAGSSATPPQILTSKPNTEKTNNANTPLKKSSD